jgi:phosphoglycolate phosphatase
MLERFDLVVFDWDGTLIDSTAAIARSIQAAAADLGLAVPDFERASHVIGLGLRDALAHAVPDLQPSKAAEFSERYRVHFLAAEHEFDLFEGARELLDALRSREMLLAVATGKSRSGLARALEAARLQSIFAATRCADQTHSKPHPAMLLELTDELRVQPERTLMIGDTTHDLQLAFNAGTPRVGVSYGAHEADAFGAFEPLHVAHSVVELHDWLAQHA